MFYKPETKTLSLLRKQHQFQDVERRSAELIKMFILALRSIRHLLTNEIHKQTGVVVFQETEFAVFLLDSNLTRFFPHSHTERYAFLSFKRSVSDFLHA